MSVAILSTRRATAMMEICIFFDVSGYYNHVEGLECDDGMACFLAGESKIWRHGKNFGGHIH